MCSVFLVPVLVMACFTHVDKFRSERLKQSHGARKTQVDELGFQQTKAVKSGGLPSDFFFL